jgi:hypothetical protein
MTSIETLNATIHMPLNELVARGGRVTRVRWLTEFIPGRGKCADLSYVHGELADGTPVSLTHLPAAFLVPFRSRKGALIDWATEEGVFAKACGLLDSSVESVL